MIIVVTILGLSIGFSIKDSNTWKQFKINHNCEITQVKDSTSSTGIGIGIDGQVGTLLINTPKQNAWLCDDGIIYWK